MPSESPENYDIEPPDEPTPSPGDLSPKPRAVGIPRPSEVQPLPIEIEDEPLRTSSVKDLDVCPNCGASMRAADELVCVRCGFDLKTMKPVRTITGEVSAPDDEVASDDAEPLIKSGNGDYWLPGILAGLSGLILVIGYLAGLPSLYPGTAGEEIIFSARLEKALRLVVLVGMLTACGMGALAFHAMLQGVKLARTVDELKLGTTRMLAIVLTMRMAALIGVPYRALEWSLEAVMQVLIFAGLAIALFRLKPRDTPTLTGAAVVLFAIIIGAAYAIVWATK